MGLYVSFFKCLTLNSTCSNNSERVLDGCRRLFTHFLQNNTCKLHLVAKVRILHNYWLFTNTQNKHKLPKRVVFYLAYLRLFSHDLRVLDIKCFMASKFDNWIVAKGPPMFQERFSWTNFAICSSNGVVKLLITVSKVVDQPTFSQFGSKAALTWYKLPCR